MTKYKFLFFQFFFFAFVFNISGQDTEFKFRQGSLLFSKYQVYFSELRKDQIATDTIMVKNDGTKPIKIQFYNVPDHLKIKMESYLLAPGKKTFIILNYNASKKNDIGLVTEGIYISTDDSISPKKELSLSANLIYPFPDSAYLENAIVPKVEIDKQEYNYGLVLSGAIVEHKFVIQNSGSAELNILKVTTECGCTIPETTNKKINPGDKTEINVKFDTAGKSGTDLRRITVITDDPLNHQFYLYLNGIIKAEE